MHEKPKNIQSYTTSPFLPHKAINETPLTLAERSRK